MLHHSHNWAGLRLDSASGPGWKSISWITTVVGCSSELILFDIRSEDEQWEGYRALIRILERQNIVLEACLTGSFLVTISLLVIYSILVAYFVFVTSLLLFHLPMPYWQKGKKFLTWESVDGVLPMSVCKRGLNYWKLGELLRALNDAQLMLTAGT